MANVKAWNEGGVLGGGGELGGTRLGDGENMRTFLEKINGGSRNNGIL